MERWQTEMRQLKIAHFKSISKEFYRLNGGENMIVKGYSDNTATGLIGCIVDYLGFNGWCVETAATKQGYTGITAEMGGRKLLVTVQLRKIKNRKGEQLVCPYKPRHGQLYFNAVDMPSFIKWFKQSGTRVQV